MKKYVPVVVVVLVRAKKEIIPQLTDSKADAVVKPSLLPSQNVQLRRTESLGSVPPEFGCVTTPYCCENSPVGMFENVWTHNM